MAFTKEARPTSNFAKAARTLTGKVARFNIAKFLMAKFGATSGFDKQARPTSNFTKEARP